MTSLFVCKKLDWGSWATMLRDAQGYQNGWIFGKISHNFPDQVLKLGPHCKPCMVAVTPYQSRIRINIFGAEVDRTQWDQMENVRSVRKHLFFMKCINGPWPPPQKTLSVLFSLSQEIRISRWEILDFQLGDSRPERPEGVWRTKSRGPINKNLPCINNLALLVFVDSVELEKNM